MKDYLSAFRLDGKVALVAGGARGLGAEIATALAQAGARVLITDVLVAEGSATAARASSSSTAAGRMSRGHRAWSRTSSCVAWTSRPKS